MHKAYRLERWHTFGDTFFTPFRIIAETSSRLALLAEPALTLKGHAGPTKAVMVVRGRGSGRGRGPLSCKAGSRKSRSQGFLPVARQCAFRQAAAPVVAPRGRKFRLQWPDGPDDLGGTFHRHPQVAELFEFSLFPLFSCLFPSPSSLLSFTLQCRKLI